MSLSSQQRLDDQRRSLIQFIEQFRPQGSLRNAVTIVFDGRGEFDPNTQIRILFSYDQSADDKIKQLVQDSGNRKTTVVVTDDRAVQYAVRALGAQVCAVQEFLSSAQPKNLKQVKRAKNSSAGPVKNISKTLEHRITSELEKVWLKRNQND